MKLTTITMALVGAFCLSGCYTYVRSPGPPIESSVVEVVLSTEGQIRLRNRVGIDRQTLQGELVSDDGQTLMIDVQSTSPMEGLGGGPLFQRIDVPRTDVLEYRTRQLSTGKSVVVAAAVAGTGVAIVITTIVGDRDPGSTSTEPPSPADRVSQAIPVIPLGIR